MKKLSSYQKLKLKIEELEKEKARLEKAIYEDDFQILLNVKTVYGHRIAVDNAMMFGDTGYNHTKYMNNRGLRSFIDRSKTQLDNLPEYLKKYPPTPDQAFKPRRKWVVELEEGVWLADWDGDPGRTTCKENAKVYSLIVKAYLELAQSKTKPRQFPNARIVELEHKHYNPVEDA